MSQHSDGSTLSRLPSFVTVDELAALMRVDRKTLYQAIERGEVPGVMRLGRTLRIRRRVVADWLDGKARVLRSTRRNP